MIMMNDDKGKGEPESQKVAGEHAGRGSLRQLSGGGSAAST
jgi:hypothetical protein